MWAELGVSLENVQCCGPPGPELRITKLNRISNMELNKIEILTTALMRQYLDEVR